MSAPVANALSFDVEEWFHVLDLPTTPKHDEWHTLPRSVEPNTRRLLEILAEHDCQATFFVLAWIAEQYPQLVREIHDAGHEIASHGSRHELVYEQGRERFRDDLLHAKRVLEDITGCEVIGYRAPGFSITEETPWAFETIREVGFLYDSSVFPSARGHGGMPGALPYPNVIALADGERLAEFPISILEMGPLRLPFAGGGYLRLFPYRLLHYGIRALGSRNQPTCIYLHPREIDPDHPRLEMSARRRFQSYVNLHTTEPKLRRLLADFSCAPLRDVLASLDLLPRAWENAS